jgi:hypothetical protein
VCLSEKLDATVNLTDEVEWDLKIRFTDADGLVNATMGYQPYTLLSTNKDQFQIIAFDFNGTGIVADDVEIDVNYEEKLVSNDKIIFAIPATFAGDVNVHFVLDETNIGSTFELNQVIYGFGTVSSYTTLATCA